MKLTITDVDANGGIIFSNEEDNTPILNVQISSILSERAKQEIIEYIEKYGYNE